MMDHLPQFTLEDLHDPTLSPQFLRGVEDTLQHTGDIRGRLSSASSDLTQELHHALQEAKGVIAQLHSEIRSRDELVASLRHSASMSKKVVEELDARTSEAEKATLEVRLSSRQGAERLPAALTRPRAAPPRQDRGRSALLP